MMKRRWIFLLFPLFLGILWLFWPGLTPLKAGPYTLRGDAYALKGPGVWQIPGHDLAEGITTDHRGFRVRQPGRHAIKSDRFLSFGSNLAFGLGMPFGETFQAQLRRLGVRIYNGAVPHSHALNGLRLAEFWAAKLNPRGVVLLLSPDELSRRPGAAGAFKPIHQGYFWPQGFTPWQQRLFPLLGPELENPPIWPPAEGPDPAFLSALKTWGEKHVDLPLYILIPCPKRAAAACDGAIRQVLDGKNPTLQILRLDDGGLSDPGSVVDRAALYREWGAQWVGMLNGQKMGHKQQSPR